MVASLDSIPVTSLKGVGPRMAEKLARLRLLTLQDVLFHLPLRYEDRTRVVPIGAVQAGSRQVIEGVVEHSAISFSRSGKQRRRMLIVHLSDGTGSIKLRFFNTSKLQQQKLEKGNRLRCFGEVRRVVNHLEMMHPEFTERAELSDAPLQESMTAVYPTTDGVHQLTLRNLVDQALDKLVDSDKNSINDYLPSEITAACRQFKAGHMSLQDAVSLMHNPPPDISLQKLEQGVHPAQQRLAFEELLAHQLSLQKLRGSLQSQTAIKLGKAEQLLQKFYQLLPFELTGAQQRVIDEITDDVKKPFPMLRLVQGDVGSGKTVVAFAACLMAVNSGRQAAVMAPTEILAEQHYQNFSHWADELDLRVAWLSGKTKIKQRREMLAMIAEGEADIIVGTHALFQDEVEFNRLSLVVIDEQHRFGVHQRLALKNKAQSNRQQSSSLAHQLIMTATPIPRTLAMTAYGDLDVSVIDELPPGRREIKTVVLPEERRPEIIQRVRQAIKQGRQVYWVCTLVEESEALQCQAAEDTEVLLQEQMPEISVGLVHGRMKPDEKEKIMFDFKQQKIQLLVATTVIEVGVDVPNASLMIIENAERLGLSQLHQLRGRVGRGDIESSCVLMYSKPLSKTAQKRLAIMRETNSGFEIAEADLKIRGPGEVLGTRQTGALQFRVADIIRDESLLEDVQQCAAELYKKYPENIDPIIQRWLPGAEQYAEV